MNNIEELERMKDDIQNIKEKYIPGLEKKIDSLSYSTDARKINQLASKKLTLKGLEINDKKGNVSFQKCYEVLVRKKRGINTIAICALVTLYELELKEVFPRLKFEIRYNLRAFWKMDRAIKLLEGFLGLQDRLLGIMQNEMYYLKRLKKNAEPVELQNIINQQRAVSKMVKKISQWQVIREYDKYIIIYNNQKFCFDLNNVKLDVVPLCKIITECCWRSICEIDNYIDKYYPKASKKSQKDNEIRSRKLDEISEMFLNFIEIHFDLRTFR